MGRMKKVAPFTDMGAAITEIVGGGGLCDGGQVQDFEASLHFQEMANEVVDVDSLHHDDRSGGLFIVCSGRQGVAVPFDHALAAHIGYRVGRLEGVVDDNEIAAAARQRPPNGRGIAPSPQRGMDFAVGLPCQHHLWEDRLIDRIRDHTAKVVGVGLCQFGRVGNANHALRRVVAEIPGRQCDRSDDRFQMAGRHGDDQPLYIAGGDLRDLVSHRVDVPVRLKRGPRAKQIKHIIYERLEIRGQDRAEYLLRRSIFGGGRTYGSVHEPPWFFFCCARLRSRSAWMYLGSLTDRGVPCSSRTGSAGFFAEVSG